MGALQDLLSWADNKRRVIAKADGGAISSNSAEIEKQRRQLIDRLGIPGLDEVPTIPRSNLMPKMPRRPATLEEAGLYRGITKLAKGGLATVGYANGGRARSALSLNTGQTIDDSPSVTDPEGTPRQMTGEQAIGELAMNAMPVGAMFKVGSKLAKAAAPLAVPAMTALSDDAEAVTLSELADLARMYPRISSNAKLLDYAKSRLPNDLLSRGNLVPMASGTGRLPMALGDELVVKAARMPRGVQENALEGDWVAPVPEAVWKSDDDLLSVVKRATPLSAAAHPQEYRQLSTLRKALDRSRSGQEMYSEDVQNALEDMDWGSLLNYDPLWGDVVKRNTGMFAGKPLLLDAGALSKDILNPKVTRETISPAEWQAYRRSVLKKAKGGLARCNCGRT